MTEFGHSGFVGGGVCVDNWGAGPFVITVGDKSFRFEDSDRFGPYLLKKNGAVRDNPHPSERSPFWRAHRIWVRQGRRTESGENCIWDEPKPTKYRRFGKAKFIIENGEEDGQFVEIEVES
jgi:hypothetical protein